MIAGNMLHRLRQLEKKIRVAIIGIGSMGKGLLHQCLTTPGFECVGIADLDIGVAVTFAEQLQLKYRVVSNLEDLHQAISEGRLAICEDGELLARCDLADAVIEATNSILPAAGFAATALDHHKHLILMNSEIDLIFGPYLLQKARRNGVTYTSCDGDQHGVIRHLIDEIQLWGFDLVLAGNIKGFLDRYSDPIKIIPEADARKLSYKMCTAYTDGTKLSIEMALLSNALGLDVGMPGMSGPRAQHVHEALNLFDLEAIRASGRPVVDYILGAEPNGGVFVVGHCEHDYQRAMLSYFKMGCGPFYVFYRPYHLCHVESMACIAAACLDGQSLLQPDYGLRTNVYAYAKRALRRGENLEGIGGFTCYGMIENNPADSPNDGLPICLADDVTLKRDVPVDGRIRLEDVDYDRQRPDFDLFFKSLAVGIR